MRVLQSQCRLQFVALLCDSSRLHFTLESTCALDNNQLAAGDLFQTKSGNAYRIRVKFNSETIGFFTQRVIFDFGYRPVIGRTLSMDIHRTVKSQKRVLSVQQELQIARWTSDKCRIIPFDAEAPGPVAVDAKLLARYELPSDINAIINADTINSELNRNNYSHRMHSLLRLEEFTRMNIISA